MHLAHYPIGGFTFDQISRPLVMPDGSPLRVGATWRERNANGSIKDDWQRFSSNATNVLGWQSIQIYIAAIQIPEINSSKLYLFPNLFSPNLYNILTGNMSVTGTATGSASPGNAVLGDIDSTNNFYIFQAYTTIGNDIGSFVGVVGLEGLTNGVDTNISQQLTFPVFVNIPNSVNNTYEPRGISLYIEKYNSPANIVDACISISLTKGRKNV
jgi:hypothetical protein